MINDKNQIPLFPETDRVGNFTHGALLRDYFAINAPKPDPLEISNLADREKALNPHNDSYKPTRHSYNDLECILRYKWADRMLKVREMDISKI